MILKPDAVHKLLHGFYAAPGHSLPMMLLELKR